MGKPGGSKKGSAAGEAAGGIFAKHADKLFRLPDQNGRRVDFLRPTPEARDRAKKYVLPPAKKDKDGNPIPRNHVESNKVDPGSSDLAKATQDARRETNDDSARNFAAYRYIDKDGNEGILVGRSDNTHSERSAGALLLDEMKNGNIKSVTEVYTERAPCAPPKGNCAQWLDNYLGSGLKVEHSWNYDGSDGTNAQVSSKIKNYAKDLL